MLKKNTPNKLEWDEDKLKKFSLIKDSLSKKPVLQLPDYNKTFYLRTGASNIGIGSVLLHEAKGKLMPVAYASRKLLSREANYSTVEKEFLSIVWSLDKFKVYRFGRDFVLQTDQQPLTYLHSMKILTLGWPGGLWLFNHTLSELSI